MSLHRNAKLGPAGRFALVCAVERHSTRAAHFSTQSVARYLSTGRLLTSRSRHPTS